MDRPPHQIAYEEKLIAIEAELGRDVIPVVGFLATNIYARTSPPIQPETLENVPPEKRQRAVALATELAKILSDAEPESMRNL